MRSSRTVFWPSGGRWSWRNPGDAVLIAGKGHETYQEIKGVRHPFDDRKVVKTVLSSLGERGEPQP